MEFDNTRKVIENRGRGETYCEKVLGSTSGVDTIAGFLESHATKIHLIEANAILEFVEEDSFTKEELESFKYGVAKFGEFLMKCSEERRERKPKDL